MTEELKQLIETAPKKNNGVFLNLMFVSNGAYNGFWGVNGYDNILILGLDVDDKKYYKIAETADVFNVFDIPEKNTFNVEIPTKYGVPRIWFTHPIHIDNEIEISTVTGEILK